MARLDFTVGPAPEPVVMPTTLPVKYDDLSPEQRAAVREEYARRQKGLCPHCLHPLLGPPPPCIERLPLHKRAFPPAFFKWPQHLHHNHRTGLTIGTYHARCNGVLAQYHGE